MVNKIDLEEIKKSLSEFETKISNINNKLDEMINKTKTTELCPICKKECEPTLSDEKHILDECPEHGIMYKEKK